MAIEILNSLRQETWDRWAVIRWGGPLAKEYVATGSKVFYEPLRHTRVALRMWWRSRELAKWLEQIVACLVIAAVRPDVVWCNTVVSACYVRPARLLGRRVVLHAHEPAGYIRQYIGRYHLERYWPEVVLIGCSPIACADLAAATRQSVERVVYLPSVPDRDRVVALANAEKPDLPSHGLLIGACGTTDYRKGVDLWLDMVGTAAPKLAEWEPIFLWIGGTAPDGFDRWAAENKCSNRVRFLDQVPNPYPWLAALDIFVLPSRTDPFPLVVLEAMLLGKPVVAFSVGGVATQLGGTGRLIQPLAVDSMAEEVVALANNTDERRRLGAASQKRIQDEFSTDMFASTVNQVLSSLVG